jgi:enoyl-CoA hydratase/carnithine racemase
MRPSSDEVLILLMTQEQTEAKLAKLIKFVNNLVEDHSKLAERVETLESQVEDLIYASDNEISMCDVPTEPDGVSSDDEDDCKCPSCVGWDTDDMCPSEIVDLATGAVIPLDAEKQ